MRAGVPWENADKAALGSKDEPKETQWQRKAGKPILMIEANRPFRTGYANDCALAAGTIQ
jgi:hypothetical protein